VRALPPRHERRKRDGEAPERVRRHRVSRIVRVDLERGRGIYVARTGRTPGHVTVWASPAILLEAARIVG
jgi:hypothetical protein